MVMTVATFLALFIVTALGATSPTSSLSLEIETLNEGQTISGAVPWIVAARNGTPSRIDFRIDGALKWTERYAPFVFNGDRNTLDTRSLSDGPHALTVAAFSSSGSEVATASVNVTVQNDVVQTQPKAPADRPDKALGRPATSSSMESAQLSPDRAVDGVSNTRWGSNWSDNQWWQVDLGSLTTIDTVAVNWETAYASRYNVQTSSNGTTFVNSATASRASSGVAVSSFAPVSARYVRILGVTRATQYGFSFWDVKVFATASATTSTSPPQTPPSLTAAPTISGNAKVGSTLDSSAGTWSPTSVTTTRKWKRCDSSGGACLALAGASAPTYVPTNSDVGATLRVDVTATTADGSTTALSSQTPAVQPLPTPSDLSSKLPARLGQSTGQSFYVDGSNGNDNNSGSNSAPWRSINKAWQTVPAGSVINVRGGSYAGQVNLTNRSSNVANPITVRAYPGEIVKLSNNVSWYPVVFVSGAAAVRVQGFTISNPVGDCIKVSNAADVEILGNTMNGCNMMGVIVGGSGSAAPTYSKNVQIWNNRFYAGGGYWPDNPWKAQEGTHSIYYGNVSSNSDGIRHGAVGGVIANNLFYDKPTGYHLEIGSQNDGLIVTNNTFDNNYAPLDVAGNAIQIYSEFNQFANKNLVIANNIISNSSHRGIYGAGPTMENNVARHNLAYNNPLGDLVTKWGSSTLFTLGAGNVTGRNPQYLNPSGKDYRLQSTSPAIGGADPAYAPPSDFSGKPRDQAPDIGALEF